jgi:hypothetical protein
MKKIEIVNEVKTDEVLKLTEIDLLRMIKEDGLISVLTNYDVPEEFILKWGNPNTHENVKFDGISKDIVISIMNLSERFIKEAIEIDYLIPEDIFNLNMKTYSNLSEKFIKIFDKYINWERMILYLSSSEKIEDISKYEWIIEEYNLWKLISANNLPIDFIRKNREKLDWRIVSIINDFSDEEKEEFVDEIPDYKEEWDKFSKESESFTVIPEIIKSTNLSVKDIRKMINNVNEEKFEHGKRFEVNRTMDELSNDDLLQIKNMIQSGNVNKF